MFNYKLKMKSENKRIFISDLPETFTKDELESSFSKYGQVSSVEIKERKELGPNNKSLFFAYINLITNDKDLNHCFQDLSNTKWHGQYVQLQIARENFLERLKRERREAEAQPIENDVKATISRNLVENTLSNGVRASQKHEPSSESETDSSGSDSDVKLKTKHDPIALPTKPKEQEPALNEDLVFKNHSSKNKLPPKGGLKIPSVGNAPIVEINLKKNKTKPNDNAANMKRLQSLRDMKKGYAAQKSLIKNALQYGVAKPNNKIRFDDGSDNADKQEKTNGFKDNSLFGEENSEDDFEVNFDVKEQFQGKSGQKLLELQSRYKNDKRFNLDERFIEPEVDYEEKPLDDEDNLEAEKNEQLKILEEVLGHKITSKSTSKKDNAVRKRMVKFDPSQPDHSNFEFTVSEPEEKKRKKEKTKNDEPAEPEKPQVSKEVFFKVSENLKEALSEKSQLNLLSMFGRTEEHEDVKEEVQTEKPLKRNPLFGDRNPFKYDSSDEEDEIEDIPHKDTSKKSSEAKKNEPSTARSNQSVFWTEPFFFKSDDFRLQEGQDFVEKIKSEDKEFLKIRRELKGIVRAKVRNNERKIKMFKKKLGGSKKRKHIRIKKALKR